MGASRMLVLLFSLVNVYAKKDMQAGRMQPVPRAMQAVVPDGCDTCEWTKLVEELCVCNCGGEEEVVEEVVVEVASQDGAISYSVIAWVSMALTIVPLCLLYAADRYEMSKGTPE